MTLLCSKIFRILIIKCKNCKFTFYSKFSFPKTKEYINCTNCNILNKNKCFEIYSFYNFKFQFYFTFLIIFFMIIALFKLKKEVKWLLFFSVYILIDQSWIRIKNKYLLLAFISLIGYLHFYISYLYFVRFIFVFILSFFDLCRLNNKIDKIIK